jgi:hypothetical protein
MPKYPREIYELDLSDLWNKTKEVAKKKAVEIDTKNKDAAKTQLKEFNKLDKEHFNLSFASNLAKWPTLFPDYKKMKDLLTGKIETALHSYITATKASALHDDVKVKILQSTFNTITNFLKKFDAAAKALDDADLASKQASGKIPPPIVVLKHPDILRLALEKAGAAPNLGLQGACPLEIVINDKDILKKFPDDKEYANQAQKIKDKADFGGLIDDVAKAIKAANTKAADPAKLDDAKKDLQDDIDKAIKACALRATDEAGRQGKLKGEARWANIKSGLKLTLTGIGVATGATAIALTPLTFGVSTIAGCVALSKSVVELGKQIATIGSEVETLADRVGTNVKEMKKGYDKWLSDPAVQAAGGVSNKIGLAEFGKRGLNAIAPTWVTTIKSVKEGVEACDQKVNNIEVRANDMGAKLSKIIQDQGKADKSLKDFIKEASKPQADALTNQELKALTAMVVQLDSLEKKTDELIDKVTALNARVSSNRTVVHKLEKEIGSIDSKNPIWSDVASALFETTASVGYMFLASSGAPEPFEFAKEAAEIVEKTHKAIEVAEIMVNLGEGVEGAIKKRTKH